MENTTRERKNKRKNEEVEKMLEKDRFLAIKKLARDIREDNKAFFDNLENMPAEEAVKEKDDFVNRVISNMANAFSSGEQGREEKQIFRANILIPGDDEFYENYSKDKNIRNLMNKYSVNIEDVMSKITELNIYGKYISEMKKEEDKFVDEMVKLSPKEAEDLLDEIDNLSNTLTNLDVREVKMANGEKDAEVKEEKPAEKEVKIEEPVKEEESKFITPNIQPKKEETKKEEAKKTEKKVTKKDIDKDDILGDSFENIEGALSGFVVDFNNLKKEIKDKNANIEKLEGNIQKQADDNSKLKEKNTELKGEIATLKADKTELKGEITELKNENSELNKRIKVLEDKLYKSATLLKKVYNGIKD